MRHKHKVAHLRAKAQDFLWWRSRDKCPYCSAPRRFVTNSGVQWGCGTTVEGSKFFRTDECHLRKDRNRQFIENTTEDVF